MDIKEILAKLIKFYGSESVATLVAVAKGMIGPESIRPSGQLRPEAANTLISLVFADDFLSRVTTRSMRRLKADGAVMDIANRSLRRVPEGSEPAAGDITGVTDFSYTLTAEECNLFANLLYSFLLDNQDNPNLKTEIESAYTTRLRAELTDLAFNGTGVAADGDFLKLNKGWIQLAKDGVAAGQQLVIDPATDGWVTTLANLLAKLPAQFSATCSFIMNTKDAEAYAVEVGKHVTGSAQIAEGTAQAFITKSILTSPFMPQNHVLLTPPKNLVFGLCQDITRAVVPHARKRVFEYTWVMYVDFEIAAKQAVVLGKPA